MSTTNIQHWIKQFYTLPIDELSGWIGDAFDLSFKFERNDDGTIAIFAGKEDFEFHEQPFMVVRDTPDEEGCYPQWRIIFLCYLTTMPAQLFLQNALSGEPQSELTRCWAYDSLAIFYSEKYLQELGWKGEDLQLGSVVAFGNSQTCEEDANGK